MKNQLLLVLTLAISNICFGQQLDYPKADKVLYKTYIHNDTLIDSYFWMRDKYSAEVINYLYANNAHADAEMKSSALLQKVIFDEMRVRLVEAKDTRPSKNKNYYYYSRTVKDRDYPAIYRKKDSLTAKEQLVLDLNGLAQQYMYFSLAVSSISPNQTLFAYAIDDKGNNIGKLFIKHIDGDSLLTDTIPAVTSFIWAEDNRTFYYTTPEPKTNRAFRVYRHILGNHFSTDELILEEQDKTIQIGLGKTSSKQYITINLGKTKSNEEYYLSAHDNKSKPVLFLKRKNDLLYNINHYEGNEFYITTNHQAINYKLVRTPIATNDPAKWETIIPHRKNILLQSATLLKNHIIYEEKENAQERIIIKNRITINTDTIKTNLTIYSIGYNIPEYEYEKSNTLEFTVTNDIEPSTTYEYNITEKSSRFIEKDSINEPYQSAKYETKRFYATSHDGVLVPLTITYKKGLVLNGNNPTLLTGYGSYGAPYSVSFSSADISYLNRGFILASAHIRGGNDLGMQWYEEGKFLNKKNSFLDFIACAEYLINQKYTNTKKLAIQGGSAGGLLVGAVVNMRPDLFKCAVANVPFVDVINTMLDESIPLTTFEFEEWGNPKQKKYYEYMKSYSPYDNVTRKSYPHMLVTAGYNDAQVGYWEPAKWVAKLRELKTDTNQILFKTNMEGGHGGASGRYAALKEMAFSQAFIMNHLGVKENYVLLKGKVVDIHNNPIEYANIYLEKSGVGTNSNSEGEFTLRLKTTDNVSIVVQSIGFEKQRVKIDMNTRTSDLVIRLKSDVLLLKTALITADGKDPAIGIIKKAIRMRKQNYDKVNSFSADVYMKSNTKLDEIPKKIPSFLKLISNGDESEIDSSLLGLVYLSESVAKYNFEKPDKVKETMIASRIAGQKQGFSFNRVEDVFINFYEPTIQLTYYSERPFVSPIAPLAMLNYKYAYEGTFNAEGKDIFKIKVTPLRKGDPLFNGHIYISSADYQIYGVDLFVTKDAQIEFVDTLFLQQEMTTENEILVPLQLKLYSHIKIFGFKATDMSLASMSNYKVNAVFGNKYFNYEVFSIDKSANKKDTQYWSTTRTITLTQEEDKHYKKSDSIFTAHNSPHFLDSMNRKRNKFTLSKILFSGYTYSKKNDTIWKSFSTATLPLTIGYNTVEGTFINYKLNYYKYHYITRKYISITPIIRYGFINQNLALGLIVDKSIHPKTNTHIGIKLGSFIQQYNDAEPINTLLNSAYTLFDRLNYAKLLQKNMVAVTFSRELINGLYTSFNLQWQQRIALTNHANFSFADKDKRAYTSNNPQSPFNDAPAFKTHQSIEYGIAIRYLHKQKFERYPEYKRILGSRFPDIYASFKQGVGFNGLTFNYQHLEVGSGKDFDLKLLGVFSFDANAGMFFNSDNMAFIDYKHFNGNQTLFLSNPPNLNAIGNNASRIRLTAFHALNYYVLSTQKNYIELHALQNFRSFFIGKVPILRKTRAHELAGINFLQSGSNTYTEAYMGLANIFNIIRIDAGRVISNTSNNNWFFRFGLGIDF
jgi:oligopeptidase B